MIPCREPASSPRRAVPTSSPGARGRRPPRAASGVRSRPTNRAAAASWEDGVGPGRSGMRGPRVARSAGGVTWASEPRPAPRPEVAPVRPRAERSGSSRRGAGRPQRRPPWPASSDQMRRISGLGASRIRPAPVRIHRAKAVDENAQEHPCLAARLTACLAARLTARLTLLENLVECAFHQALLRDVYHHRPHRHRLGLCHEPQHGQVIRALRAAQLPTPHDRVPRAPHTFLRRAVPRKGNERPQTRRRPGEQLLPHPSARRFTRGYTARDPDFAPAAPYVSFRRRRRGWSGRP